MFNTPVLLLIFNRPDVTAVVFESIKKIKPAQLFIAADGPRKHKEGEQDKCMAARKVVMDSIDWDCDVKTLFQNENIGCKYAVSGAITWFFEHVEEGIILEDDCLPGISFFNYCSELLKKYKDNTSVMHISANYFNKQKIKNKNTYYFSHYIEIWGWATWRRAWKLYDPEMQSFPKKKNKEYLKGILKTKAEKEYWMSCFEMAYQKQVDTWDYQWVYCIYTNSGVGITPYLNLVSNLGFGDDATHTVTFDARLSGQEIHEIIEIKHPPEIKISKKEDQRTFKNLYRKQENIFKKIIRRIIN